MGEEPRIDRWVGSADSVQVNKLSEWSEWIDLGSQESPAWLSEETHVAAWETGTCSFTEVRFNHNIQVVER